MTEPKAAGRRSPGKRIAAGTRGVSPAPRRVRAPSSPARPGSAQASSAEEPAQGEVRGSGEGLSHLDGSGAVRMVDVGEKPATRRRAVAAAVVVIGARAAGAVRNDAIAKGNVLEIARIAGIQGAKRTHELIPLCHPLPLDHVGVECRLVGTEVRIVAEASAFARTGVEMEALTAASIAALTVYDMVKAVEPAVEIRSVHLREKSGGRRGTYRRDDRGPV